MPDYTLPGELNNQSGGIDFLYNYITSQVSSFGIWMLVSVFLVMLGAGYFSQQRRSGNANFPMWFAISSFITTVIGFILFLQPGLINLEVVVLMMSVSLIAGLWFLFSGLD